MDFAQNLVTLRKAANLSQDKLAEQLHMTRQAVSKWESGTSTPDLDTVMKLCVILDVTPNQLLIDCNAGVRTPGSKQNRSTGLSFLVSSIFLMVIFVCGVILYMVNLYNGVVFEANVVLISLGMMTGSLIAFVVMTLIRMSIYIRKAKKEQG